MQWWCEIWNTSDPPRISHQALTIPWDFFNASQWKRNPLFFKKKQERFSHHKLEIMLELQVSPWYFTMIHSRILTRLWVSDWSTPFFDINHSKIFTPWVKQNLHSRKLNLFIYFLPFLVRWVQSACILSMGYISESVCKANIMDYILKITLKIAYIKMAIFLIRGIWEWDHLMEQPSVITC